MSKATVPQVSNIQSITTLLLEKKSAICIPGGFTPNQSKIFTMLATAPTTTAKATNLPQAFSQNDMLLPYKTSTLISEFISYLLLLSYLVALLQYRYIGCQSCIVRSIFVTMQNR